MPGGPVESSTFSIPAALRSAAPRSTTTGPRAISARFLPSRVRSSRSRRATRMRGSETPVADGVVVLAAVDRAPARADSERDEFWAPPEQAATRATSGRTRSFFICNNLRWSGLDVRFDLVLRKTPGPPGAGHHFFSKRANVLNFGVTNLTRRLSLVRCPGGAGGLLLVLAAQG